MNDGLLVYEINGRRYRFKWITRDFNVTRGFCIRNHKWATLTDNTVKFDGESILVARKIS